MDETLQQGIARIRAELAWFGVDTSHMTDEDIIEAVNQMAEVGGAAGLTMQEAAEAAKALRSVIGGGT